MSRAILVLCSLSLAACSTDLSGDWAGKFVCDPTAGGEDALVKIELEIDGSGDDYEATGEIGGTLSDMFVDGQLAQILVEMEITKTAPAGGQVLDVEMDCELNFDDGSVGNMDCSDVAELGWDGENTIEATVDNFLGTEDTFDCELKLER